MLVWVYESHLGGLFATSNQLTVDECYCEQCGDYDWEVGCFESMADFIAVYADNIAVSRYDGGYDIDFINYAIGNEFNDKLTHEQIKEIVIANRVYKEDDE